MYPSEDKPPSQCDADATYSCSEVCTWGEANQQVDADTSNILVPLRSRSCVPAVACGFMPYQDFRDEDDVDIRKNGKGFAINAVRGGEYLRYSVDVATKGMCGSCYTRTAKMEKSRGLEDRFVCSRAKR